MKNHSVAISPNMNIREGICLLWENKLGGEGDGSAEMCWPVYQKEENWDSSCIAVFLPSLFVVSVAYIKIPDYYLQVSLLTARRYKQ